MENWDIQSVGYYTLHTIPIYYILYSLYITHYKIIIIKLKILLGQDGAIVDSVWQPAPIVTNILSNPEVNLCNAIWYTVIYAESMHSIFLVIFIFKRSTSKAGLRFQNQHLILRTNVTHKHPD